MSMRLRLRSQQFAKELPGTKCVFKPADLDEYLGYAWDIRISIADAPLEEAFYFAVEDPGAVNRSISELLDMYALNPALRDQLDVDEHPDLPYLQEELIQYRENEKRGLLSLEFFVNNDPEPGAVDLNRKAVDVLSVCTPGDGEDYLVLDLVLVATVPDAGRMEEEQLGRELGRLYLLRLIGCHLNAGEASFETFASHTAVAEYVTGSQSGGNFRFCAAMRRLETEGLIRRITPEGERALMVTDKGRAEIRELDEETARLGQQYDIFDSVGIAPPALGVPDGFDARVQMMEYDGQDCARTVLLRILDMFPEEYLGADTWYNAFENDTFIRVVLEALAYKTNFSREVLDELKRLARSAS